MLFDFFENGSADTGTNQARYYSSKDELTQMVSSSDVILINAHKAANAYKAAFHDLTYPFKYISVSDMGILKDEVNLSDANKEIVEVNKKAVIFQVIREDQKQINHKSNVVLVSPGLSDSEVIENQEITLIGYQRHIYNPAPETLVKSISLGDLMIDLSLIEPHIRKSKTLVFDLSAIKASEMMCHSHNPCGLSILQACKIARYAGFSDNIAEVQMIVPEKMNLSQQNAAALFFWYFLEGRDEYLVKGNQTEKFTSYILANGELDLDLEFLKDENSAKWWLKNPTNPDEKVPCNYQDYERVLKGEDPSNLLALFDH